MSLLSKHWTSQTRIITLIFAGFIGVAVVSAVVFPLAENDLSAISSTAIGLLVIVTLVPLYADWVLGSMVDNLLGVPSGDILANMFAIQKL